FLAKQRNRRGRPDPHDAGGGRSPRWHRGQGLRARGQEGRLRHDDESDGAAVISRLSSCSLSHGIGAGRESSVMRKATAISAGLHAAVLLWATLSFSGKSFEVTPAESLPVDFISQKDFLGCTNA